MNRRIARSVMTAVESAAAPGGVLPKALPAPHATKSAAVYFSDWDNVIAPEIINYINADSESDSVQVNATGGEAKLSGLELQGTVLLSENLILDGTFGYNKSEIKDFESPDALNLFGDRTIDGLDNAFSRYPETSGTLSLTYQDQLPSGCVFQMKSATDSIRKLPPIPGEACH